MEHGFSIKFWVDFVPNFGDCDNFSFSSQVFFDFVEIVHVIVVVAIYFLKKFKVNIKKHIHKVHWAVFATLQLKSWLIQ